MDDLLAYMLGPKAENEDLFKNLILEALEDHLHWRRNYHPEDAAVLGAGNKDKPEYRAFVNRLRDRLFDFLSRSKEGVPFSSPRYLGHMNTDLLIPALVGYFGAMLYNQNNVAGESSPVTCLLESEVLECLIRMVGYDPKGAFGYICSGGTAANTYALWVARNLRTYSLAARLALEADPSEPDLGPLREALRERLECIGADGETRKILEFRPEELFHLPIASACCLRQDAARIAAKIGPPRSVDRLIGPYTLAHLGESAFRRLGKVTIGSAGDWWDNRWIVYAAENCHYSWGKALELTGMGSGALKRIAVRHSFDMDPDGLRVQILEDAAAGYWPLFVTTTFGTTEEGAIDDLHTIRAVLEQLERDERVPVWWHVDAAFGGYLPSMFIPSIEEGGYSSVGDIQVPGTLKHWLAECCRAVGFDPTMNVANADAVRACIEMSEHGDGWVSWRELIDRCDAMQSAHSVSLDPHKWGYIPYPAGAVLLRDARALHAVRADAPYLWTGGDGAEGGGRRPQFVGQFTLEGSRPGAAAAACWLAHTTVPLDQRGHGRMIALSVLSARRLYRALRSYFGASDAPARLAFLHRPHTNMLCYVPYLDETKSIGDVRRLIESVAARLHPANEIRPWMAVTTDLDVASDSVVIEDTGTPPRFRDLLGSGTVKLKVLRSVVMGAYGLNATTRRRNGEILHVYEAFARDLGEMIQQCSTGMPLPDSHGADGTDRAIGLMLMDDNEKVLATLGRLATMFGRHYVKVLGRFHQQDDAIRLVKDLVAPLRAAILDIDMRGTESHRRGTETGGYDVLEEISKRNQDLPPQERVRLVIIFTARGGDFHRRIEQMRRTYGDAFPNKVEPMSKYAKPTGASSQMELKGLASEIELWFDEAFGPP